MKKTAHHALGDYCRNGHAVAIEGRDKFGHCRACQTERAARDYAKKRQEREGPVKERPQQRRSSHLRWSERVVAETEHAECMKGGLVRTLTARTPDDFTHFCEKCNEFFNVRT